MVVIGLIALLAALALPAIGRTQRAARRTVCLSHQKQWTVAQMLYAHENEDRITRESFEPNGVTLNLWADVRHAFAGDVWYNALPRQIGIRPAIDYAPLVMRADFYSGGLLFHCPAARFPGRVADDPVAYFSLAMNSKLILVPHRTITLAAIRSPHATVLFLDNLLPDEPMIDPLQAPRELGQPSAYANRAAARHEGRVNLAFVDGHVDSLRGADIVTNGLARFPQVPVIWTADPQRNPNF